MKKINIHNFWRSDAFIILMFALMSVLSVAIMWSEHVVIIGNDFGFHWQRIYEMHDAMLHGSLFPKVALNTFNQSGSAAISLYPNLNVYPMALLSLFIKHFITLYYVIFLLRNFFALIIGYYACKSFTNNKKISFLFTISYTLSTTTLAAVEALAMLGTTSAIIFMPLVLFGFLKLLDKNEWIELSIGMSAIILCHVLDAIIVIVFLLLLTIINFKRIWNKNSLKSLGKAILITFLVTGFFWMLLINLIFNNQISTPIFPGSHITGIPFKLLLSSFLFRMSPGISLVSLLGLIFSLVKYKEMARYSKQMIYVSIIFILLSTNFFPWVLLHHTIVETTLQFPWRFLVIPNLLLCYLFSTFMVNIWRNQQKQLMIIGVTIGAILLMQMLCQIRFIQRSVHATDISVISNDEKFHNLMDSGMKGKIDYYPQSSAKMYDTINQHFATYDGNKHIGMKLLGNGGYEFSNQARIKDLSLPFLYYNGIDYQVKLDGKTVNGFANNNSLMTIKNVNKGRHHVRIIIHNTKMQIVSYITSLIGLIILLGAIIKKYIKRR